MKLSEITVLLPCHSLEDFPVYYEGGQANELLAAWSAVWHPALVASAGALPAWQRVDLPPESLAGRLMAVPPFCLDRLPAGFEARAKSEGAILVRATSREAAVAAALAELDGGAGGVDEQLAADFLALGFCRLQIELLTRQMRYSVHIDETHFQNEAVAAAEAAMRHDVAASRVHLAQCFDTLYEARKRFYPVDVYLIDVTLLAQSTLGAEFERELARVTPTNLLGATGLLDTLSARPAAWSGLLSAIDGARVCVLGGEEDEPPLPLEPLETALASLAAGVRRYQTLLGRGPQVYARRRAGLWPALPQLLVKLGYQGALHFTLDDGRFPVGPQSKTRWEGLDTSTIDVLGHVPCDANKPETFLSLSRTMADSMDNDHVATVSFAHWPGATSPWYDDLRRIAELSPVLGKFMLLDDYFNHTDMPGRLSKFNADEYRTPYLKQAIVRNPSDPISTFVGRHRAEAQSAAERAIATLRDVVIGRTSSTATNLTGETIAATIEGLAMALPRAVGPEATRCLVVNPLSFARGIGMELSPADLPSSGSAVASAVDRQFAVVEVPAMGFAWVTPGDASAAPSRARPIARENVLANEFFELTVNRKSGGIQSIYNFNNRGNQISQQIGFRLPVAAAEPGSVWRDPDEDAPYAVMQAESVETTVSLAALGEIVSRGSLVDAEGRRRAGFRQTTQVWAGSRVVRVEIELDGIEEPRGDAWNSYYAARFAWPDEAATLSRGVSLGCVRTGAKRLEAPEFVDVDSSAGHVTILTGGLPYHRRVGPRMLDSLLVVRGETARRFSLGIGIDLPQPAAAAMEFLTPPTAWVGAASLPASPSGWLFHIDAKNVVATHWEVLVDDDANAESAAGRAVKGFRARLLETAGRAGRVVLRAPRPLANARQIDFLGQTLLEASVDDDKIRLDFAAHEWIEVEALWKR